MPSTTLCCMDPESPEFETQARKRWELWKISTDDDSTWPPFFAGAQWLAHEFQGNIDVARGNLLHYRDRTVFDEIAQALGIEATA